MKPCLYDEKKYIEDMKKHTRECNRLNKQFELRFFNNGNKFLITDELTQFMSYPDDEATDPLSYSRYNVSK